MTPKTRKTGHGEEGASAVVTPATILLVDDDLAYRDRLLESVAELGAELRQCAPEEPILDALREDDPAIVVVRQVPGTAHAVHTIRTVRRSTEWARVSIVVMTPGQDPDLAVNAYSDGADAVLRRSHSVAELSSWIRGQLLKCGALETASGPDRRGELLTGSPGQSDVGAPHVIVIEDDPSMREMLEHGLTAQGYEVETHSDGRAGLSALLALDTRHHRPVVLLDVDLPGIDGFQLLAELSGARPGDYQVMLVTGHRSEASQVPGIRSGATDYIVKPIQMPVLLAKVARLAGPARRR